MNFSTEFTNKYGDNKDMQKILINVEKSLSPFFQNDNNYLLREMMFEAAYGYKKAIADVYNLPMDNIYKNIGHLNKILAEDPGSIDKNENYLGYFLAQSRAYDNIHCGKIVIVTDRHDNLDDVRETLTHELVHLFAQQYLERKDGTVVDTLNDGLRRDGQYSYINEVMTQTVATKILEELNYKTKANELHYEFENEYLDDAVFKSKGLGYSSISQTGLILEQVFEKDIYEDMFLHNDAFVNKANVLANGEDNNLATINKYLLKSFDGDNADNYMELYKELSNLVFQKVDKENMNVAEYINLVQKLNDDSGCYFFTNNEGIKSFDMLFSSREIERFYKEFNPKFNPETDLEKEINPFTRSKECTNFLIIMDALKDMGEQVDMEKIDTLTYRQISRNKDAITLHYQYDGYDYIVDAKKDLKTGILILEDNVLIMDKKNIEKPSLLQKLVSKESKLETEDGYEFIANYSKISDYSGMMMKISSVEKAIPHAVAIGDYKYIADVIEKIDIEKMVDASKNNLLHIASINAKDANVAAAFDEIIDKNYEAANRLLNAKNSKGLTPVDVAFEKGNLAFFDMVYKNDLKISNLDKEYGGIVINDEPMLYHFEKKHNYSIVRGLIMDGYDLNLRDSDGNTILHKIVENNENQNEKRTIINALIKNNFDADVENKNHLTPLMEVCKSKTINPMYMDYICSGLDANLNYKNYENRAAIHYLAQNQADNNTSIYNAMDELISHGARLNTFGTSFMSSELVTPLQIVVGAEKILLDGSPNLDYSLIAKMVANGADISLSYGNVHSALEVAQINDDLNMFKAFIDGGVKVENLNIDDCLNRELRDEIVKYANSRDNVDKTLDIDSTIDKTLDIDLNADRIIKMTDIVME